MTQDVLSLDAAQTDAEAIAVVRGVGHLPPHTDRLFVVDSRNVLVGAVRFGLLLGRGSRDADRLVDGKRHPSILFYDEAEAVATAFERYDLLSAPVVDDAAS